MSQYLVLTAMGSDRRGCVSELTKLVSKCGCSIMDSRMAIFGQEFTFIMLIKGDAPAITTIESKLPAVALELELITMMKRTSGYQKLDLTEHYQAEYTGIAQPGVLKSVTAFFASRDIDISSLTSNVDPDTNLISARILFAPSDENCIDALETEFIQLCDQIDIQGRIQKVNSTTCL